MTSRLARKRWLSRLVVFVVVTVCVALAGCDPFAATTSSAPTPQPTRHVAYHDLEQRPLHLPALAVGAPCVTTKGSQVSPDYGIALGNGPVYPVGLGAEGVLEYAPSQNFESSDWGGQKVLWVVSPAYHGLVLIRGGRLDGAGLDGAGEVRFQRGDIPPAVLEFDALGLDPDGWNGNPSYTRIRAPGCYAYQVGGDGFSEVIVFQAVPV